jgi:hypothetical protein
MRDVSHRAAVLFLLFSFSFLTVRSTAISQESASYQEAVGQADRLFQAGNYRNAAERYFFASRVAKERLEFGRAYLGLAISYFSMKDAAAAEKWSKMVLDVVPRADVSVPDYPISFVQFFERVRNDFFKGAPPPAEAVPLKQEAAAPAETPASKTDSPAKEAPPETTRSASPPAVAVQNPQTPQVTVPPLEKPPAAGLLRKGGKVNVQLHFSSWTIDPVIKIAEGLLSDNIGQEVLNKISDEVRSTHFALIPGSSEQDLSLDSSGSNFGVEIRYYSRGWPGTFSLGLSIDTTTIHLALSGRVKQSFTNGTYAEAEASGRLTLNLASTLLNFRWDISPLSRLSPYFIMGLGITPFKGVVNYEYAGSYNAFGFQESISDGDEMTLSELAEENDFQLLDVFVVLQLAVGLDLEIYKGLTAVGEAGLWDGFYLRGGLGYRF